MTEVEIDNPRAGKTILVVEDDPDQLVIRALLLEREGFICARAMDASSAIRAARELTPDCVLMDLNIPTEQDGVSLIQSLQVLPVKPAIVILTGRRVVGLRGQPDLRPVTSFVEKGSPTPDLIAAVMRACN